MGIVITVVFHLGLILLLHVEAGQTIRPVGTNPRVVWVGDKTLMEEGTMREQVMRILDPAPLFLPTTLNFAGARRDIEETGPPGEIFRPYPPVMVVPGDPGAMGLFSTREVVGDPAVAVQEFRWPYFSYFQREDTVVQRIERRLARIEVRAAESAELVLAVSLPPEARGADQTSWPDWEPFELFVTLSATGRMSEPVAVGRGSRSEVVDAFMQDFIRKQLRLDLRLGPGSYRVLIGP